MSSLSSKYLYFKSNESKMVANSYVIQFFGANAIFPYLSSSSSPVFTFPLQSFIRTPSASLFERPSVNSYALVIGKGAKIYGYT
jgi:hypothetical protein